MYDKYKNTPGEFEVIFVSSDEDENSMRDYYGDKPWKALHFKHRNAKNQLSRTMGVRGIPTLAFINAQGRVCQPNARRHVLAGVYPVPVMLVEPLQYQQGKFLQKLDIHDIGEIELALGNDSTAPMCLAPSLCLIACHW